MLGRPNEQENGRLPPAPVQLYRAIERCIVNAPEADGEQMTLTSDGI